MAHADVRGEHDMQHDGHDLPARSSEHARDQGGHTDQHGTVLALDGNVDDTVRTQTLAGTEALPETSGAPETPVSHPHVPVYSPALLTEFTLKASGRPHEGVPPKVALAVGGKRIAEWLVTSSFDEDQWATYSFLVPGDQLDDLTLQYLNDVGRRDLWVRDITIGGQPIDLATATYVRANRDAIPGQSLMAWRGELQFRNIRIR
jgi:hypothetical protein